MLNKKVLYEAEMSSLQLEIATLHIDIPVSTTDKLISSTTVAESLLKESVHKCNVDFKFEPVNSRDIIKTFRP